MKKALEGVRVIDLTTFMSGPFATMILGDLGAEIIKVEQRAVGDASRAIPPHFHDGESLYYISLNRNKKAITLDLNSPRGKEIFLALVRKADVVIDNYRPGITRKLGIDYARLAEVNERIICCSITAYGTDGPYGDRPAYDLNIQALSGSMSMTGEEGRVPLRLGVPMGDLAASMWSTVGILAALRHRDKEGEGQLVDIALLDSLAAFITYPALYFSQANEVAGPVGSGHQSIVPFQAFKTKDQFITVSCANEKFWGVLCDALEAPELKHDPRFARLGDRLKNKGELNAILDRVFESRTCREWSEIFSSFGVPFAPVNAIDKVFDDPALLHRGMVVSVDHSGDDLRMFGNPIKLSRTPIRHYSTPPRLGGDNVSVLTELLDLSVDEVKNLMAEGVI
ncbi:MAG: CoA transferase [Burkholderiales bacterium]|nr:CoA transferase [Burkholderiales bacterium]OJX07499.1 MAG: hypothetical protein BGO72_08605 [Burkholderiales bacterium 70-64]